MLVKMQLFLPRDARYVVLMRNVVDCVLTDFDAPVDVRTDMRLAVTEACANVVRHATDSSEYSVRLALGSEACEVEVVDMGPGFPADAGAHGATDDRESGRGLFLIRALVDDLQFARVDDTTHVRILKRWPGVNAHDRDPEPDPATAR